MTPAPAPSYLTIPQIAEILGVEAVSVRTYHQNAQRNRREGRVRRADMPTPDMVFGRSPVWKPTTIKKWLPKRGLH